jgi:hypothetical protein
MKRWFPESGEMGKQHEPKRVRVGQLRSLILPIQNDQLLAQQGIFYEQFGTAAS